MNLECFKAVIQGYSDRIFDQQILTVQSGYWAAYYQNAKHPKPIKTVIDGMISRRRQAEEKVFKGKNVERPEVDVEAFLATEEQFLKRLQSK